MHDMFTYFLFDYGTSFCLFVCLKTFNNLDIYEKRCLAKRFTKANIISLLKGVLRTAKKTLLWLLTKFLRLIVWLVSLFTYIVSFSQWVFACFCDKAASILIAENIIVWWWWPKLLVCTHTYAFWLWRFEKTTRASDRLR